MKVGIVEQPVDRGGREGVCYNSTNMAGPHIQKVVRVGNSNAVVIPAYLMRALDIQRGDAVVLSCVEEGIVSVRKVNEKDLHDLRTRPQPIIS